MVRIAIIGGGPTGASAAIELAKIKNSEVILVERRVFPRDRPGETLHPGIESLLKQLGVYEQIERLNPIRPKGIHTYHRGKENFAFYGGEENPQWQGFQILRRDLDAILLQRARELGTIVLQPQTVRSVIKRNSRVMGVCTDHQEIMCDFVIDGSGGSHWLQRKMKLPVIPLSQTLITHFGYTTENPGVTEQPQFIWNKDNWLWRAEIQPQLYQWTYLPWKSSASNSSYVTRGQKSDVTWRKMHRAAGRGYFAGGDAAFTLDPSSSHGVLKALMSGIMCGYLIQNIALRRIGEDDAIDYYNNWIAAWCETDVGHLQDLYRKMAQWEMCK
ncbi:NAD(P)/FAD-dependent oxidoreductase [Candidatus Uabimicrobium amorphum]|uniref:FAD-dependent oxidoreductase n=1 Tax=Uabimicrobium amorphum TaxID=2596890 RepID=A0A5S9F2I6_UABAM|nr:tryptophan 7-halogenase [Candidatus Uabimicrobium amorphum]BBM82152.1 FAD-dependent oxidoreductase [Candidatus Uabimicrobium amorphum]